MAHLEQKGAYMQIFAPAKINLFLHIVGKRSDGFHELETLMVPISLADTVRMRPLAGSEITLRCSDPGLPVGPENLIYRAVELFRQVYHWASGVEVEVEKRIPVGAGLGGGSGNAAATLLGLRAISGLSISDLDLADLAGKLGSDAAFFVAAQPAICRGRGEIIEPITLAETYSGLLINPGFGVSTPWAYQAYARNPRKGVEGARFAFGTLRNDLEPPVLEKYLWIAVAKNWLRQHPGVADALMSGSGSSVFAILKERGSALEIGEEFKAQFGQSVLVLPIDINPSPEIE